MIDRTMFIEVPIRHPLRFAARMAGPRKTPLNR